MDDIILITIKKMLGLSSDDESFDHDIIIHINGTLMILHQLGVSALESLEGVADDTTWGDCFGSDIGYIALNAIKNYIYLKVRKGFDPPQSSTAMESLDSLIKEYEWRINALVDPVFEISI